MSFFLNGVFFSLVAMLAWGVADYYAALAARKIGSFRTFFWTQVLSLLMYGILFRFIDFRFTFSVLSGLIVIVAAVAMLLAYAAFYKSLEVGKIAIGTAISSCWAVLTVLIGIVFLNESLSVVQLMGMALAITGIILTSVKKAESTEIEIERTHKQPEKGTVLGLLALISWGVAFALIGILVARIDWFHAVFFIKIVSVGLLGSYVLIKKIRVTVNSAVPTLILVGVLETVAYLAYGLGVTLEKSTVVAPIASTYPIVAVLMARIFLKEKLGKHQYFGLGFVLGGVILLAL